MVYANRYGSWDELISIYSSTILCPRFLRCSIRDISKNDSWGDQAGCTHRSMESGEEVPAAMDLVRLAIPHRVYTQTHVDYVVEAILQVYERRASIRGYRIISEPKFLRHFTAQFAAIEMSAE